MTVPLSRLYGEQVKPEDKAVIDYWLINPDKSIHEAVSQGYPKITKRGSMIKHRNTRAKPEVIRYEYAMRAEAQAETNIKMNQSLVETAAIAHSNAYDYMVIGENGESARLKSKEELSEAQQRCVKEIRIRNTPVMMEDGTVETASDITLKLWDKQKATNDLGRMLGWNGKTGNELPGGLRTLMQIGVLVLPANQTYEEAVASYIPYDGQIIEE